FQAEDGIRDFHVTGVQTCALPILVELAKYGLGAADMAACINWFSKVVSDDAGNIALDGSQASAGNSLSLRFEMDTLVVLHACPRSEERRVGKECRSRWRP